MKNYKSAMGKVIDIDKIRLSNEETIAIGNMKVNARGDELGPGGQIVRSRNEIMNDYYKLKTPVADSVPSQHVNEEEIFKQAQEQEAVRSKSGLRGNLADSVARKQK